MVVYNIFIRRYEDMTKDEFKTIMEMVRMIIRDSKDKEEALRKIESLAILRNDKGDTGNDQEGD